MITYVLVFYQGEWSEYFDSVTISNLAYDVRI